MAHWIGFLVSIKCIDASGTVTYQGEIESATNSFITLSKAFCNGIPCSQHEPVKIRAEDVLDITLIEKSSTSPQQRSTVSISKPSFPSTTAPVTILKPKRQGRSQSASESGSNSFKSSSFNGFNNKSKPIDIEPRQTPSRKERNTKNKWTKGWKDEECFGSPLDEISQDFDFEKNLALFNKQAIWEKLNGYQKPDIIKQVEGKKPSKYRHNENVLGSHPVTYQQITVPKPEYCEFVTDDGLVIPSISRDLRNKLWESVSKVGLGWERRIELMGRAATEISLQLLGGGHRLNPHNSHQCPTVVILCGPNRQGAMGVNAARQLASHGVQTIVYNASKDNPMVKTEIALYKLSNNLTVEKSESLPTTSDLVILALHDDEKYTETYLELSAWTKKIKAPILALDPPSTGCPGFGPKFSLLPVLPLPHTAINGKLYLCNLSIPDAIFCQLGIGYKSPFGSKFVIPLHPKN